MFLTGRGHSYDPGQLNEYVPIKEEGVAGRGGEEEEKEEEEEEEEEERKKNWGGGGGGGLITGKTK